MEYKLTLLDIIVGMVWGGEIMYSLCLNEYYECCFVFYKSPTMANNYI